MREWATPKIEEMPPAEARGALLRAGMEPAGHLALPEQFVPDEEAIDGFEIPLQKIRRRAARNAIERVSDFFDKWGGRGDTPIERVLFAALRAEIEIGSHDHTVLLFPVPGTKHSLDVVEYGLGPGETALIVESQVPLDGWKVDSLISTRSGSGHACLIVECDGHDFHERTKEQASKDRARDRKFQADGYTVFRFTGSEIWRDPCGCADQIIDLAVDKACV